MNVARILILCSLVVVVYPSSYTTIRRYGWSASSQNLAPIKFGTPITLENGKTYSTQSRHIINAYELYFHWLNTVKGGIKINGSYHPAELVLINDNSVKSEVASATRHLINDLGIRLLFGPYSSGLTNVSAYIADQLGATVLASGAASDFVFRNRPQVFGTSAPADRWFEAVFTMLSGLANPPKRIAYLQEDVGFTRLACSGVSVFAASRQMTVVKGVTVPRNAGTADVEAAVLSLKNSTPDVVFSCNYPDVCRKLLNAAVTLDFNPRAFVVTLCVDDASFVTDLGRTGLHVMGLTAWSDSLSYVSDLTHVSASQFSNMYQQRFHIAPHYLSAGAWSACALFVNAIESSNSVNPTVVADAIRTTNVKTLYGRMSFDSIGQAYLEMKIIQRESLTAGYNIIAPAEVANAAVMYPKPTWLELKCSDPAPSVPSYGYNESGYNCGPCPLGKVAFMERMHNASKKICRNCPVGQRAEMQGGALTCRNCSTGYFWCGQGWQSPAYPAFIGSHYRESRVCQPPLSVVSSCLQCPAGRYSDAPGSTMCKACEPGKYMNVLGRQACFDCGNWSRASPDAFAAVPGSMACVPCPTGGLCELDSNSLRSGYVSADGHFLLHKFAYQSNTLPLGELYKCPHGDGKACLSHNNCYIDEESQEVSMHGVFCGSCKRGFAKGEADNLCKKCGPAGKSWALAFSSQLLIFMVTACLAASQMIKDPRRMLATHVVILRQFLNYIHLSTVVFPVSQISYAADQVNRFLGAFQYMAAARSPIAAARGAECFLQELSPDMDAYKAWMIAGALMVPSWIAFDLFFFLCIWGLCKLLSWPTPGYDHIVIWITMNLVIIQLRLSKLFLMPFDCVYVDTIRLLAQTSVVCNSSEILPWQIFGLVCLLLFSIGIPVALMGVLYFYKSRNRLQSVECARMFGFFFHGFSPNCYYMEGLNMIRKVVFQLAAYIPWLAPVGQDAEAQKALTGLSLLLICVVFLGIHLRWQPYDFREFRILHNVESAMLWALLITCLAQNWKYLSKQAWIFTSESSNKDANTSARDAIWSIIVIFFHVRFLGLVLYGIFGRSVRLTHRYQQWIGGSTELQLRKDGLQVDALSDASKAFLADTIRELTLKRLKGSFFGYSDFNDAMRKIGIESFYQKDRESSEMSLPFLRRNLLRILDNIPEVLTRTSSKIHRFSRHACFSDQAEDAPWRLDPHKTCDLNDLDHATQYKYSVEDFQLAVVRLAWQPDGHDSMAVSLPDESPKLPDDSQSCSHVSLRDVASQDREPEHALSVPTHPPPPPASKQQVYDDRDVLYNALQLKDAEIRKLGRERGLVRDDDVDSDVEEWA